MFDWAKKTSLFTVGKWMLWALLAWSVFGIVVGRLPSPMGRQLSPQGGGNPLAQQQVPTQPSVHIPLNPGMWTQVELCPNEATTVFLPGQPFHLDIRPGGDCNGLLDLGYKRVRLHCGMPHINAVIPPMVQLHGEGSVFFQAQPVRY